MHKLAYNGHIQDMVVGGILLPPVLLPSSHVIAKPNITSFDASAVYGERRGVDDAVCPQVESILVEKLMRILQGTSSCSGYGGSKDEFIAFFEIPELGVDTPRITDRKPYRDAIMKRLLALGYEVETSSFDEFMFIIRWCNTNTTSSFVFETAAETADCGTGCNDGNIIQHRVEACMSLSRARENKRGQAVGPLSCTK